MFRKLLRHLPLILSVIGMWVAFKDSRYWRGQFEMIELDTSHKVRIPPEKLYEVKRNNASIMVSYEDDQFVYDLIRPENS